MSAVVFRNCNVFDGVSDGLLKDVSVLVEDDRISQIGSSVSALADAIEIGCNGRTLMPGLIDAHVHVYSPFLDERLCADLPPTYMAVHATHRLKDMLERGFTSVRDAAGGDFGIKRAVETGLCPGPRMFISGQAISMTGGHGDFRKLTDPLQPGLYGSNGVSMITRIADGVTEMRRAVRDELRKGADQIKLLVSGGVGSPYDPLEGRQFSEEEIRAAVDEAAAWGKYVCVHSYTSGSTRHSVECGVRCVEHGNLIDEETAELMAETGAFMVPTLVCYEESADRGPQLGLTPVILEKLRRVNEGGLRMLELCRRAGVQMGFGTDLMGELLDAQCREFQIKGSVLPAAEVLRSATSVNARILQREGELGVVAPGAIADLIVVDGNPLEDLGLFDSRGSKIPIIMQAGSLYRNRIA